MKVNYELKPKSERRSEQFRTTDTLSFGILRTDHMFLMDYNKEEWGNARIVPYGPLEIMPGAVALHYGQEIFEGSKAFKHADGDIYTFRLDKNAKRLNRSAEIMCMPKIPLEETVEAIHRLIDVDRLWLPEGQEGNSLYIRPFMFGSSDYIGLKPSKQYTFGVFLSPSGPYYTNGTVKPITLLITKKFHRAVPGGTGSAKTGGNYGGSFRVAQYASKFGADELLYLDPTNQYLEEAGTMTHFHVAEEDITISKFSDTVLESITSQSILEFNGMSGIKSRQSKISLDEFIQGIQTNKITEAGGLGTAAVVTPVGTYIRDDGDDGIRITVNGGKTGKVTRRIYELITGIQQGKHESPKGWLQKVERF